MNLNVEYSNVLHFSIFHVSHTWIKHHENINQRPECTEKIRFTAGFINSYQTQRMLSLYHFKCLRTPLCFAYRGRYWCIFPMKAASLKFHSRPLLCNRKSIYIFIKWCLIENGTASFETSVTDTRAKGQQLPGRGGEKKGGKKLQRDFISVKTPQQTFPSS